MNVAESLAAAKAEMSSAVSPGSAAESSPNPIPAEATPSAGTAAESGNAAEASTSDPKASGTPTTQTVSAESATADPSTATADPSASADPVDTRLLAIARAEQRQREQGKRQREELETQAKAQAADLELAARKRQADALWRTDPLAALEALGYSADDIYAPSAIDRYLGKAKPPTPEELAARVVDQRLAAERKSREESDAAAVTAREAQVRQTYVSGAKATLRTDPDRYPHLVRALAIGEVEASEIADCGQKYHEHTGKTPEYAVILGFLETELSKTKQSAQKIEAKAQPQAVAKPPVSTSHAPPAEKRPLTAAESLALAKREAGLSA